MKFSHCNKLNSQFTIIYNYFIVPFDQTSIALFIFFNNWLNRRKWNFSASRSVFSCMLLRIVENLSLSVQSVLYKHNLFWNFFTTYLEVKVATTFGKAYGLRYLNKAITSDSFALRKAQSCRQHDLFDLYHWQVESSSLRMMSHKSGMIQKNTYAM